MGRGQILCSSMSQPRVSLMRGMYGKTKSWLGQNGASEVVCFSVSTELARLRRWLIRQNVPVWRSKFRASTSKPGVVVCFCNLVQWIDIASLAHWWDLGSMRDLVLKNEVVRRKGRALTSTLSSVPTHTHTRAGHLSDTVTLRNQCVLSGISAWDGLSPPTLSPAPLSHTHTRAGQLSAEEPMCCYLRSQLGKMVNLGSLSHVTN